MRYLARWDEGLGLNIYTEWDEDGIALSAHIWQGIIFFFVDMEMADV